MDYFDLQPLRFEFAEIQIRLDTAIYISLEKISFLRPKNPEESNDQLD